LEWSLFQDSEQTIHGAEINDTSYESQADSHWEKNKNQKPNPKIAIFELHQYQIYHLGTIFTI
jgi:hypothetical protein